MADTTALKNRIRAAIKANDNQEITGPVLQQALLDIVDELNGTTETEASARQSGDSTLQQNLNTETQQRQNADSTLQQGINTERQQRQEADTQLNNLITGIKNNIDNGYVYAGIAAPSTTPVSGKVFYIVRGTGTFTHFKNANDESIVLENDGIYVFTYKAAVENNYWEYNLIIGIDDEPTAGSKNLVKSGGVAKRIENSEQQINGNEVEYSSSSFGDNVFSYFFKANRKYSIICNRTSAQYTDLFAVNADGTHESTKISTFVRDREVEWTPTQDYYGLYTILPDNDSIEITVKALDSVEDKIITINEDIVSLNNKISESNISLDILTQEVNGNEKTFNSSKFGDNVFPYFFKSGRRYSITANRTSTQYTDLFAVNADGTHESTKITTFVRDREVEWTPSQDYYGLYTILPNNDSIELLVIALDTIEDKIENINNGLEGLSETNKILEQEISGDEKTITKTGAAYYTIDYIFQSGKKYYISVSTNAPNGVIIYAVKPDGTHTQLIGSFLNGDKKIFNPIEDYIGYYFGVGVGISATITTKADNLTDNVNVLISEPIELYAYADGDSTPDDNTHFYGWKNGKCAWQRAIDSTDGKSKYKIYCFGKIYVNSANQFFVGSNGYHNVVFIPNTKSNIELIGQGEDKTMLVVDMADDFADYATYQPMEVWGNNTIVKSMTITSKNARYCIHMDASGGRQSDGFNISFYDVTMRHYPNAGMSFESPFGLGISDGMNLRTERCSFITSRNYIQPLYLHDNVNFTENFVWTIKNCRLINPEVSAMTSNSPFMTIQTLGSNIRGTIVFEDNDMSDLFPVFGCENNNTSSKTNASKYDANVYVKITGNQDAPIGYETKNSTSAVLRVTSKSTGANSSVRFDEESSAFDIIVRGLLPTGFTDIYGIVHTDGYQYRDGVTGLNGYAMGELAIDSNRIVSMQNRLGDCTSNNKSLGISVDGVDYTITFNQNYTSYTDEQMLQVFSDVIGSVADVELYNWGADYFPEIEPILCTRRNTSNDVILKGMGVKLKGTLMRKATQDSEVDGIAIDDILPTYVGRVARKCTLNMYKSNHHHIALETYPTDANDKYRDVFTGNFGIGETAGVFKKIDGGILSVDYYGYVTFNP